MESDLETDLVSHVHKNLLTSPNLLSVKDYFL